mgnify:CR=1 FL=1
MIKFKKTLKELKVVGQMLKVGLQKELIAQKHNATGRLSRGLNYEVKGQTLNVTSSVSYWKAVNNPKFAKTPNFREVLKWVQAKGLPVSSAESIFKKLRGFYGKPYVYWTEGNNLRRTNFAGYVANKFSKEVANKLAPSIGADVASMIREKIKNNTKAKVS